MRSNRREFLSSTAFAEPLSTTPPLTLGPFHLDRLPLDTENELIIINNSTQPFFW